MLTLIWLHFIADFLLQSDKVALNKGKSLWWLSLHSFIYGVPFLLIGVKFAIITAILHGVVDFVTSKITSYFWVEDERHWFFATIGFDQAIHITLLFLLMEVIG